MKLIELHEAQDKFMAKVLPGDVQKISKKLQAECSIAVEAYKSTGSYLMRGIRELKGRPIETIQSEIRQDRKPIFMPSGTHDFINRAMMEIGLKAHRGNSIFCTTDNITAGAWGQIYAVFPVDGWTGTVFQRVKVGYAFDRLEAPVTATIGSKTLSDDGKMEKVKTIIENLKPHSFTSASDLSVVLKQNYEDVLITGTKYYGLVLDGFGEPSLNGISSKIMQELGI